MSPNTNASSKVPKKAPKAPGTPCGPMGLPVSYNIKEYKLKPDAGNSGKMRVSKSVRRRSASGANRYSSNKLLSGRPIK